MTGIVFSFLSARVLYSVQFNKPMPLDMPYEQAARAVRDAISWDAFVHMAQAAERFKYLPFDDAVEMTRAALPIAVVPLTDKTLKSLYIEQMNSGLRASRPDLRYTRQDAARFVELWNAVKLSTYCTVIDDGGIPYIVAHNR